MPICVLAIGCFEVILRFCDFAILRFCDFVILRFCDFAAPSVFLALDSTFTKS